MTKHRKLKRIVEENMIYAGFFILNTFLKKGSINNAKRTNPSPKGMRNGIFIPENNDLR